MYKGHGVYRFLDRDRNTIYIGMTNNAHRRIYQQHFTNRGHLAHECYQNTARVDLIKLNNNLEAKGLEDYLINKYKPKFNKRDKAKDPFILNQYGKLGEVYSNMEKWKPFRTLKPFNTQTSNKKVNDKVLLIALVIFFMLVIIVMSGGM